MILTLDATELAKEIAAELVRLRPERDPNALLSVSQIAAQLSVSVETVRQLIDAGVLARVKGIKERRVKQSTVDAYGKPEGSK